LTVQDAIPVGDRSRAIFFNFFGGGQPRDIADRSGHYSRSKAAPHAGTGPGWVGKKKACAVPEPGTGPL